MVELKVRGVGLLARFLQRFNRSMVELKAEIVSCVTLRSLRIQSIYGRIESWKIRAG